MFKRKKQPSASKDPGPVDNGPGVGSREATTGTGQAEGFICPSCMLSMSGPEELQEHWDRVHLSTPATVPMSEEDQHLEALQALKDMFEQSEKSRDTMKLEMQRLIQEIDVLTRGKAEVEGLQMSMSERAAELNVEVFDLKSKLNESQTECQAVKDQLISLQLNLKEQEIRNERLSTQIQQGSEADDVKALRQELTTLQSTIEENATEHDKHVKEIQEAKSRAELLAEQLSQEVRTLKETLSSCPTREDLARKEQEISHVRSELDRKEIELKKMEISFESLRGEASGKVDVGIVEQLKDSNERFKNDIAELKRDLKEREERLSSLQRTLLEAPKQDFVDQLQSQLKDLKEEGMKRDGKMRELEATHLQLEGELQRAPKAQDLESRDAKIKTLELELAAAPKQERMDQLEAEIRMMRDQLANTPKAEQLLSTQTSLREKEEVVSSLQEKLREKTQMAQTAEQELKKTQEEMRALVSSLDTARTTSQDRESEIHSMEVKLASLQEENKHLLKQTQHLEKQVNSKEEKMDELVKKVEEGKESTLQLEREKADLIKKIEAGEGVSEAIAQLEQDKIALQSKIDDLLQTSQSRETEQEQKIGVLEGRTEELKVSLEARTKECELVRESLRQQEVATATASGKAEMLASELKVKAETLQQKESSYSELQEALKTRLETLQAELTRQTTENVRLSEQLQQTQTYSGERESALKDMLANYKTEATKQIQALTGQLKTKGDDCDRLQREWSEEKLKLSGQVSSLEVKLQSKQSELDTSVLRLVEVERKQKSIETSFKDDLQRQKEDHGREKSEWVSSLSDKVKLLHDSEQKVAILQEKLTSTEQLLSTGKEASRKLAEEMSVSKLRFDEEVKSLRVAVGEERVKISQLEKSFSLLKKEKETLDKVKTTEIATLSGSLEALKSELKSKQEIHQKIVVEKETERLQLLNKIAKLESDLQDWIRKQQEKSDELNSTKRSLQETTSDSERLQEKVASLEKTVREVQSTLNSSQEECVSLSRKLASVQTSYDGQVNETDSLKQQLSAVESQKKEEITRLEQENKKLTQEKDDLRTELDSSIAHCTSLQQTADMTHLEKEQLKKNLTSLSNQKEELAKEHEAKLDGLRQSTLEQDTMIEGLTGNLGMLRTQLEAATTRKDELEQSCLQLTQHVEDLRTKNKSLQDENRGVMTKCLAEEEKVASLDSQNKSLEDKVQELTMSLHKLDRERQTLEKLHQQQVQRKWEDDKEVVNCSICTKKFGGTTRKHHCRNCGKIFCQACTSKQHHLAASKKPVRVCDHCYDELIKTDRQ